MYGLGVSWCRIWWLRGSAWSSDRGSRDQGLMGLRSRFLRCSMVWVSVVGFRVGCRLQRYTKGSTGFF